jgi:hypothetical protein
MRGELSQRSEHVPDPLRLSKDPFVRSAKAQPFALIARGRAVSIRVLFARLHLRFASASGIIKECESRALSQGAAPRFHGTEHDRD